MPGHASPGRRQCGTRRSKQDSTQMQKRCTPNTRIGLGPARRVTADIALPNPGSRAEAGAPVPSACFASIYLHLRETLLASPRAARCRDGARQRRSQNPMHQIGRAAVVPVGRGGRQDPMHRESRPYPPDDPDDVRANGRASQAAPCAALNRRVAAVRPDRQDPVHQFAAHPESRTVQNETLARRRRLPNRAGARAWGLPSSTAQGLALCSARGPHPMHQFAAHPESPVAENATSVRHRRPPNRATATRAIQGPRTSRRGLPRRFAPRKDRATRLSQPPPPRRVRRPSSDAPP